VERLSRNRRLDLRMVFPQHLVNHFSCFVEQISRFPSTGWNYLHDSEPFIKNSFKNVFDFLAFIAYIVPHLVPSGTFVFSRAV